MPSTRTRAALSFAALSLAANTAYGNTAYGKNDVIGGGVGVVSDTFGGGGTGSPQWTAGTPGYRGSDYVGNLTAP